MARTSGTPQPESWPSRGHTPIPSTSATTVPARMETNMPAVSPDMAWSICRSDMAAGGAWTGAAGEVTDLKVFANRGGESELRHFLEIEA